MTASAMNNSPRAKSVLITGCSEGGLGFALAKEFHSRGLHVFATARSLAKMAPLANVPGFTLLQLDVTSAESLAAAVAAVSAQTSGRLDYLVNNSGSQYVNPILDVDMQKSRDMFEVNVWGVVSTTRAFAPLVIAARGSIVNMASIAGLMYPPYMVLYAATKAACITISEGLRLELRPFGVKVVTVITGNVKTNIFVNAPEHHLPEASRYGAAEKEIAARATGTDYADMAGKKEDFARDLAGDILKGASGRVYRGKMSTLMRYLTGCLPTSVIDMFTQYNTGLGQVKS
ncbi:oxidoreductase [Diplogelasinospora grovesii]|uniref:Oxidoreductase n=1 Tax=Diplogelasinospora grovesii TaxID=303347 RepID=A0AAN6NJH6_9PEZI|nr:oxidoreductase [Diplogelasinospora grovesii]